MSEKNIKPIEEKDIKKIHHISARNIPYPLELLKKIKLPPYDIECERCGFQFVVPARLTPCPKCNYCPESQGSCKNCGE